MPDASIAQLRDYLAAEPGSCNSCRFIDEQLNA